MDTDLDALKAQQKEELAALKAQQKEEREMKKARRSIKRSRAKQMRSKARQAAKAAYPESGLILVWNGRPIAVREMERPAKIVRSPNVMPRSGQYIVQPVISHNYMPRASYNYLASMNERRCSSGNCRVCTECEDRPAPRRDYWTLSIEQRRKILEKVGFTPMPKEKGGDEFHMYYGTTCYHINQALELMIDRGDDIFSYLDEEDSKPRKSSNRKPASSKNVRPRKAPAKKATSKKTARGRKSR